MTFKFAIASDHAGYDLKEFLKDSFKDRIEWIDLGTDSTDSVDYPDFGQRLAKVILTGEVEKGVLICGTGIGISIAANRYPAVRAALCHNATEARLTRAHNDANVLALGARIIGLEVARDCLEAFMATPFEGGRHEKRVKKLCVTN
ncbi:MAG: ribose 5-phosphate isomerase B [Alphaproteobacteria bacterium]|nr:ribose 5-phosphate isomerase B [Alphaproteobacteria bacterium]